MIIIIINIIFSYTNHIMKFKEKLLWIYFAVMLQLTNRKIGNILTHLKNNNQFRPFYASSTTVFIGSYMGPNR